MPRLRTLREFTQRAGCRFSAAQARKQPGRLAADTEPRPACLPATCFWDSAPLTENCGKALTRLRFKVFQVYFIFIFIYVLVSAHHHNGKFKLKDRNHDSSMNLDISQPPTSGRARLLYSQKFSCLFNYLQASKHVPFQTPFPECLADPESASSLL